MYVAGNSTNAGGEYALSIRHLESFKLTEWIAIPADAIRTHLWEGQSIRSVFAPLVLTLLAGLVIAVRKRNKLSYLAIAGITA
jgi:hypothetical protein